VRDARGTGPAQNNRKFVERFHFIEEAVRDAGGTLEQTTLKEMDALWEESKKFYPLKDKKSNSKHKIRNSNTIFK